MPVNPRNHHWVGKRWLVCLPNPYSRYLMI
jgi:hypothetical protein